MSHPVWSKSKNCPCWVGDTGDLARLIRVVEERAEAHRSAYVHRQIHDLDEAVKEAKAALATSETDEYRRSYVQERLSGLKERLQAARAGAESAPPVRLTVDEKDSVRQSARGTAEEVLSLVDERRARSISIEGPDFYSDLNVGVDLTSDGVRLRVAARKPDDGRAAFDAISGELDETCQRPYRLLGAEGFRMVASLLLTVSVTVSISLGWLAPAMRETGVEAGSATASAVLIAVCAAFLLGWGLSMVLRRVFAPGFDLVRSGSSSRPLRWASAAVGLLGWLTGLVVPWILG